MICEISACYLALRSSNHTSECFLCSTLSHHDFVLFHFTEQKKHHGYPFTIHSLCHYVKLSVTLEAAKSLLEKGITLYSILTLFITAQNWHLSRCQIMSLVLTNNHICFLALFLGRIWPRREAHGHNLQTHSRSIRNPTATERDFKEMDENRVFGSADRGSRLTHRYSGCADALRMII